MRIDVRGRNVEVTDEVRDAVVSRFKRVGKQVSELAHLEVELQEERNPRISDRMVAEATLYLKGVTLRHPPPGQEAPREAPRPRAHPAHYGADAEGSQGRWLWSDCLAVATNVDRPPATPTDGEAVLTGD